MVAMVVIPYIMPLFLGMTYDARNSRPGVDIFHKIDVDDPAITTHGITESNYRILDEMKDLQDALEIEGDLSLKIKTGMLDISGKGSYLKNEGDFFDRVEVLTTVKYTSKVESFKAGVKPRDGWATAFNPAVLGTHYVSEVIYGAEMIASLRFVITDKNNTLDVKADVKGAIGKDSGMGAELVAEGKLEKLEKKLEGKARLEISYYGTVPLKSIPNSIEGLRALVRNFSSQIDETESGIPMSVKITPLTAICDPEDKEKFEFLKNADLEDALQDFEEKYDELRRSRLQLVSWSKALPYNLKPEYEREIGFLIKNMTLVLEAFYDTVWEMDLTKGAEQLQSALDVYNYDGDAMPNRYDQLTRKLMAKLTPLVEWDDVASDTYVQWGSNNCTAPSTVMLHDGFTISSTEEGIGGAAAYMCSPTTVEKGYLLDDGPGYSHLAGIRYTDLDKSSNPFVGPHAKEVPGKGIPCAKCYSPDSADIVTFPSAEECPMTWEPMYRGYLMSARKLEGFTSEYICVDEYPSKPFEMEPQKSSKHTAALTVASSGGSLPSDKYPDGTLIKCIVCTMKSNQVNF